MEWFNTALTTFDKFLSIGSNYLGTVSKVAMDVYQMDTMFKMGELKVNALFEAADASIEQAVLQKKEYEIERQASQVQALQLYQQRLQEYSEAAEYNNFVNEARLGGGESMSVRKFAQKQAETVAQDTDRMNTQSIMIDASLRKAGHMSMLNGLYAAKAQRQQALATAYQNTIDLLNVTPDPFTSVRNIVGGVRTISSGISEALKQ
jgi:hypothetical protein